MQTEPLNVSMMTGRVAIAAAALTHGLFATFVVGATLIGAVLATVAYFNRKEPYLRLSRTIAFTLVLSTATISFMGVVLVFLLNIYWPRFWSTIFRIMFWPFILEGAFFLGEAVFIYAWYYTWNWGAREGRRRPFHLAFVWFGAGFALIAMMMIDMTASYMLTPEPPGTLWAKFFNPTFLHLDIHRFFGNLAWAGFGLAALSAIGFLRARAPEDRAHYQWAGRLLFAIGFGALLILPISGFLYLRRVRYTQPQAFFTLMLGDRSPLFDLVALLYGLLVAVGSLHIYRSIRSKSPRPATFDSFMPVSLAAVAVAAILLAMPYQIQRIPYAALLTDLRINPLGKMQPNKYIALALLILLGLFNLVYFIRAFPWRRIWEQDRWEGPAGRPAPYLLISLAVLSIMIYLSMGWVRETARASNGYLIYGMVRLEDERATYSPSAFARRE